MRKVVPGEKAKVVSITCDRCKTTYHPEQAFADAMETQEFLSYRDVGGYGNKVVGDTVPWSIDLCQNCTQELLGQYIRKGEIANSD
jgi:hypothetical protein